jgi:hypothetical protein
MSIARMGPISVAAALAMLSGYAAAQNEPADLTFNASGSPYFTLSPPMAYKNRTGLLLTGRVCRRARTTMLSPQRVRLEHLKADGHPIEVTSANVETIPRNADQACTRYGRKVGWTIAADETIRACFDHGKACPANAPAKTMTAPDALPVAPPSGAPPTSNR